MHAPATPGTEFYRPDHPIDDVVPSPYQNRETPEDASLGDLADSIRAVGVLQPLVLRTVNGSTYELVAGERRWRAARLAGLTTVPVTVRALSDVDAAKAVIIENDQRKDVSALERARGYARLMTLGAYSDRRELAKAVSRDISWVHSTMKLLDAAEPVQKALAKGSIQEWHAIAIARLQPADQLRALQACQLKDPNLHRGLPGGSTMSVKALQEWIALNVHMDLDKAPFPTEDADLVPAAGACSACPKRAGAQPELHAAKKANTCTDRSCYEAKIGAHTARRLEALSTPAAPAIRIVQPYYLDADDKKRLGKDVLTQDQYRPAGKKVCPHTRAALLLEVDSGAIAKETSVCTAPGKCSVHAEPHARASSAPSPAEKAAAAKRKAREQKWRDEAVQRRELLEGLRDAVTELRDDDLRLVAVEFLHKLDAGKVHKLMAWPRPAPRKRFGSDFIDFKEDTLARLAKASARELASFLIVSALEGDTGVEKDYYKPDSAALLATAKRWGVSAASIAKKKVQPGPSVLHLDEPTLKQFANACCAGVADSGRVVPIEHGGLLYAVTGAQFQGPRTLGCWAHRLYERNAYPPSIEPITVARLQSKHAAAPGRVLSSTGLIVTGKGREYVLGSKIEVKPAMETSPRKSTAKKKR